MLIIGNKLIKGKSNKEIADEVYNSFDIGSEINFEERYIDEWIELFRKTIFKLRAFLDSRGQNTGFLKGTNTLQNGWNYLNSFTDDSKSFRKAAGFSLYSYLKQGGYISNPQFLFGTAYQFL